MQWATYHIQKLQNGETIKFRPRGSSMAGKIESGQLCTVVPIETNDQIEIGNIVLCTVSGSQYLHLVRAVDGDRIQIGNNRGKINGWTNREHVYGKVITVED